MKLNFTILVLLLFSIGGNVQAQSGISFTSSTLSGVNVSNPTTLAFGPDNRLYVTQQNGIILAYTIQKNGPNNYSVTNTETISLVRSIPNHNDRGDLFSAFVQRQVTGIVATGTAANPVLYICSSDPRIGGGGELGDIDLDTNSGTISKLTKNGSNWQMVHLVRGLPRCEENHSPNGLVLDEVNNILYVAQGGNTNAGSPSNNFGFLAEYALSAAILEIDIDVINNQFGGSYTLPTLDDPTRPNLPDGSDVNDPFGGNDGRNQAKLVIGGPVQIYAPGFRLSYDLLVTKTPGKAGRMYTIGNGGNAGWGGYPENEGQPNVTNNRIPSEPGSTAPTLTDDKVNNRDGLHFVSSRGYYAGHPNPIRANPAGAGLYWFDNATGTGHFELSPTPDWPPYPVSMANPVESDYRNPGVNDGSLYTWAHSTNGIAEYTSTAFFNGAMAGNLLAACWDGGIHRVELSQDGTTATQVTKIFTGFGDTPLDVIAQGDGQVFPGTIWAVVYGGNGVTIFEPVGNPSTCTGDNDNYTLDDDSDGYSNGDETDNGTNPCSAASKPNDYDLDFVSDLADTDDDNDGQNDIVDKFALDANNGMNTQVPLDYPFLNGNPGFGLFGIGQTGVMTNNVNKYSDHYDLQDPALIAGGAVGVLSVPASAGDAVTNNQQYAFQFGIPIGQSVSSFILNSRLLGSPFFNGATGSQLGTQSVGMYFGNGDQDNYFKFVLHANNGNPGFQILCEQNGVVVNQQMIPIPNILLTSQVDLFIEVDALTGLVKCRYQTTSTPTPIDVGQNFTVSGNLLSLLLNRTNAVAVGVIASCGNKVPFSASWDFMKVTTGTQSLTNIIRINAGGPAQNFGGEAWVADQFFSGGSLYSTSAAISNTVQDQIYQTERYGNFQYAIPVPSAGTYAVDLHLAEIYFTTQGARVFNINIENGQFVRNNLDLIQTYGSINQANVLRADNLNITDGTINISFTSVVDNAKISGIAVGRYGSAPGGNTPPVVIQPYADQSVPATQTTLVVQLNQIFNDNGGVSNLSFTVPNNTNAALISNTQIVGTQLTFTLSGTTGSGLITLRATDASNTFVEDVFQLTVTPSGTSQLVNVVRINSGGPAQNFGGEVWVADQYFTGGAVHATGAAISNTTQDQIYQTERWGNFQYSIPVPSAGMYAVDLHLAEILFTTAGARVFNINIENGQFVRNGFDIIQTYGVNNQANVLRADNLNITDGAITISFTSVVNNSKISGIAVSRYDTGPVGNTTPVVVQAYPDQSVPATQTSLVVQLNQIFNDDGGVNNLTFTVPNNTNAALLSNTQIVGTQLTFTLSGTTGSGLITLRATDASNASVEDVFQLTVTPGGASELVNVIRINAGGAAQNFGGEVWVADQYFTGGTPFSTAAAISNTTQDQIYQSERWGNFQYAIPVGSAGTYAVDLHLAEIFFTTAGSRVFNINIENGQFVRNGFDIIQTYGVNNQANVLRADNLNITDGTINISFTSVVDNAKISGIAVGRYGSAPGGNTPPVVIQPYADQSVPATQTTLVVQLNQIFNDNGGVSNLSFTVPNNTNAALISNTQIVGTQLTFTLSGTTGSGLITLRATDASNTFVEDVFQLTVTPSGTSQLVNVVRINSGGPAQNFGGEVWVADQYFTGGAVHATGAAISNTTQDQIYQTERWGNFQYSIPVPSAGMYAVDLHLAEILFTTAGARVFNINIENGQFVRNGFDIIQTYGVNNQANVLRADNLNITDGAITISFTSVVNNSKISGIAVSRYDTGPVGNTTPVVVQAYPDQSVPATQTSLVVQLNQIFNDDGGVNNLTFTVPNNTNAALLSNTQIVGTQLTFTLSGTTGSGLITLRATDASNASVEDVFQLTVTPGGASELVNVIRINAGGAAQNFGGEVWVADQYFTGGTPFSTAAAISNTTQDQIYQSERWGNFQYAIPVGSAGTYAVDLHLAEIFFTTAGSRVFNINIENGQFVRNGFDIIQTYGVNNQANVLRADNLNITDGTINISFTSIVDNAKISGIAVGRYNTGSGARTAIAGSAPIVTKPENVTIYEGQAWTYQVQASDPDGDRLSYATKNLPASLYIDKSTGLIKGTIEVNANTYPVTIKVSDHTGLSTEVKFVVTIAPAPIPETPEQQKFVVFPNPTDKDEFSVRLEAKQKDKWNFTLLDFTGKQVSLGSFELSEGFHEVTLDLAPYNLSAGLYYLSVQNSLGKKVIKVGVKL